MSELEQTLDSTEIADMLDKEHSKLLRDIRRYVEQFNEAKIGFVDFFKESTYVDAKGETRPCYRITKKGCEFIAHKMTGAKGTAFTARYINRFHEMQDMITQAAGSETSIAQMEKLQGFIERYQQFMERQEKINCMVIEKLESSKCIQVRQVEKGKEIFTMSGMKGEIINIVELVKDDRIVKMIYGFVIGCKKNSSKTQ